MAKLLSDLFTDINLLLSDTTSGTIDNDDRTVAINLALDYVNGRGAYRFQKETTPISFVADTFVYTPSISSFKAPGYMEVNSLDRYPAFSYVDVEYFRRKRYRSESRESMFAIEEIGGTFTVYINHFNTETLDLVYYSNFLVLDDDGSTRKEKFADNNDRLLIPDRHSAIVTMKAAEFLFHTRQSSRKDGMSFTRGEYDTKLADFDYEYKVSIPKPTRRMRPRISQNVTYRRITRK